MSELEEVLEKQAIELDRSSNAKASGLSGMVDLLSSVRFGIFLLILLLSASLLGMLIMQQNVAGFDRYFAEFSPFTQSLLVSLGLFDIYHSWYFNALLALLSLNIILASLDRFPKTWTFVSRPKLEASTKWLKGQRQNAELITSFNDQETIKLIMNAYRSEGWRKPSVTVKNGKTFVFAQSGVWNRLGAYPVHVALLTIFTGGFLTAQLGFNGLMPLSPGQTTNKISEPIYSAEQINTVSRPLPFSLTCLDLRQKLLRNDGSLDAANTIDWITRLQITDESGIREGTVQLNKPFDYRGYRFFHSSFLPMGKARKITIKAIPETGNSQELAIDRDGKIDLTDGTSVRFVDFRANFSTAKENANENSTSYDNPAAILEINSVNGQRQTAYAFSEKSKEATQSARPVAGYTFKLVDFEKVAEQHILSVQRDPGANVVYFGFGLLFLALSAVFFFSHQRIWAAVEATDDDKILIVLGGNTNRNEAAFDAKFKRLTMELRKVLGQRGYES